MYLEQDEEQKICVLRKHCLFRGLTHVSVAGVVCKPRSVVRVKNKNIEGGEENSNIFFGVK